MFTIKKKNCIQKNTYTYMYIHRFIDVYITDTCIYVHTYETLQ